MIRSFVINNKTFTVHNLEKKDYSLDYFNLLDQLSPVKFLIHNSLFLCK